MVTRKKTYNVMIVDDQPYRDGGPVKSYEKAIKEDSLYNPKPTVITKPEDVTLKQIVSNEIDIILLDFNFEHTSSYKGDRVLQQLQVYKKQNKNINTKIILLSEMEGYAKWHESQQLVSLFDIGVTDFIVSYVASDFPEIFKFQLDRALTDLDKDETLVAQQEEIKSHYKIDQPDIIGESDEILNLLRVVDTVALTESTVLITGESGTGKELVAKAIHCKSHRRNGPFVPINCTVIPEKLIESELFGHEKGAFTDAHRRKIGLFEKAEGGSILLDEIGDMELSLQVKLLRVLEEKCFERVGGVKPIKANVRVIASTNRDLETAVEQRQFREDLYFRLSVVPIDLSPLREHKADIKPLFVHFLKNLNKQLMKDINSISDAAMDKIMQHYWPGNVRELKNVLERAMILAKEQIIAEDDIFFKFGKGLKEKKGSTEGGQKTQSFDPKPIVKKLIKDRDKANAAFIKKYDQESFDFLKNHYSGSRWRGLWDKYKLLRGFKIEDNTDYTTEQKVAIADEMKKALIDRGETTKKRWAIAMAMGMTENSLKGMVHHLKRKNKGSSA